MNLPESFCRFPHRVIVNHLTFCELQGRRFWLYDHEGMCRNLLEGREWEPHVRCFLERFLCPGDVFVDIGAAFGVHTLTGAGCVGGAGQVIAFEPQPEFYALLSANCVENGVANVELHQQAVGGRTMVVGLRAVEHECDSTPMADVFLVASEGGDEQVQCVALDDVTFPRRVQLVKIDVQGAEPSILLGGQRFLNEHRPYLIVEFEDHCLHRFGSSSADLFALVRQLNYVPIFLEYDYPSDHLCVPREDLPRFSQRFGGYLKPLTLSNPYNHNRECGVTEKLAFSW